MKEIWYFGADNMIRSLFSDPTWAAGRSQPKDDSPKMTALAVFGFDFCQIFDFKTYSSGLMFLRSLDLSEQIKGKIDLRRLPQLWSSRGRSVGRSVFPEILTYLSYNDVFELPTFHAGLYGLVKAFVGRSSLLHYFCIQVVDDSLCAPGSTFHPAERVQAHDNFFHMLLRLRSICQNPCCHTTCTSCTQEEQVKVKQHRHHVSQPQHA
ncbi:hypothetical protein WJX77_012732 [Trebouxia sp. C0004]